MSLWLFHDFWVMQVSVAFAVLGFEAFGVPGRAGSGVWSLRSCGFGASRFGRKVDVVYAASKAVKDLTKSILGPRRPTKKLCNRSPAKSRTDTRSIEVAVTPKITEGSPQYGSCFGVEMKTPICQDQLGSLSRTPLAGLTFLQTLFVSTAS